MTVETTDEKRKRYEMEAQLNREADPAYWEREYKKLAPIATPSTKPERKKASPPRPMLYRALDEDMADTFWESVDRQEPHQCWEWTGVRDASGYGRVWTGRMSTGAHRVAYVLGTESDIPGGAIILHKCDNRACCNPSHLKLGTYQENYNDMVTKGRGGGKVSA